MPENETLMTGAENAGSQNVFKFFQTQHLSADDACHPQPIDQTERDEHIHQTGLKNNHKQDDIQE